MSFDGLEHVFGVHQNISSFPSTFSSSGPGSECLFEHVSLFDRVIDGEDEFEDTHFFRLLPANSVAHFRIEVDHDVFYFFFHVRGLFDRHVCFRSGEH